MEDVISQAKAELNRAQARMLQIFAATPDDKLNWSAAPTARTPVELVAHAATAVDGIQGMLTGKPFGYAGVAEFDAALRASEKEYTTRAQAQSALEHATASYLAWLDTLMPEQVGATAETFFGSFPMAVAITFAAEHMRGHTSQLEYLQTTWGDRDWHIG